LGNVYSSLVVKNPQNQNDLVDEEISGSFKYIGILSKQSKKPSGLGRLI
jgi:hypothetical protein